VIFLSLSFSTSFFNYKIFWNEKMKGNSKQRAKTSNQLLKWILIIAGTIFVGIGIIGIFLPILFLPPLFYYLLEPVMREVQKNFMTG